MLASNETSMFGEEGLLVQAIDQQPIEDRVRDLHRLRNQYFSQYVEEWRQFLRYIRVIPAEENVDVLANLQDLTRGDPQPYRLLFTQVLYNTTLPTPQAGGA